MPLRHLLFGFTGRIARLPFYGGLVLVSLANFAGGVLLAFAIIGFNYRFHVPTPPSIIPLALEGLGATLVFAGSAWALLALQTKRLHDLGRTGSILLGFYTILAVLICADVLTSHVFSPLFAIPLTFLAWLVAIAFTLWLVFAPGSQGDGRTGTAGG